MQWKDSSRETKVDYWYKDLTKILLLHSKDLYEVETDLLIKGKRFHIYVFWRSRTRDDEILSKKLLVDSDADDGNVIDERSYFLGEIDGKDEYNILKKTSVPSFNGMIKSLRNKLICTSEVYNLKEDRQTLNHTETKLTYIPAGNNFVQTHGLWCV